MHATQTSLFLAFIAVVHTVLCILAGVYHLVYELLIGKRLLEFMLGLLLCMRVALNLTRKYLVGVRHIF